MIQKMKEKRGKLVADMRAMVDAAEAGERGLTPEEQTSFDSKQAEYEALGKQIEKAEALEAMEAEMNAVQPAASRRYVPGGPEPKKEFQSFGEFIHAVRFNPNDQRLDFRSEMQMAGGNQGGFAVPTQFMGGLLQVEPGAAIFRPRSTVIPAGTPPDAALSMVALDQTAAQGMFGGVSVTWIAEGARKPETDARIREITLTPKEVAGHLVVTDKLLRNWTAAGSLIETQFRKAILAAEDFAFLSGNGVGRPLGVLASNAVININRAVANQIAYADVARMYARAKLGGSLAWVASQSILPQLLTMVDAGNNLVWQPNAREGAPGTLMGLPLFINDRSPVLGARGDLLLADLSYYLIKDGSGIFVDASPHVFFRDNKTVIKAFWNVDGSPWLTEPLTLENGFQVSPFVVLDIP